MKLTMYQVDAFAEQVFEGNPAAVCPLECWLDDCVLQAIAEENNVSETAFFIPVGDAFELRWFTPVEEVDLCGHATLAAAHVLFKHMRYEKSQLTFLTRSGELVVRKHEVGYSMNFPAAPVAACVAPDALIAGLGHTPNELLAGFDYVAVYSTEEEIQALTPDFTKLQNIGLRGVVATAPGKEADFVSRCFFPKLRVNEDPVTGSAHCELAPLWAERLGKNTLIARQLSKRSGTLRCEIRGDRVMLVGNAADYMQAEIQLP